MPLAAAAVATTLGALAGCLLPLPIHRLSTRDTSHTRPAASAPDQECSHPQPTGPRGWVQFGNRCRRCGQRLGPATTATALSSGAVVGLLTSRFPHSPLLPALLISGLLAVAAAYVDIRCRRLPDALVLPGAAVSAATIIAAGLIQHDPHRTLRAFTSSLAVGVVLLILAIGTRAIGLGDIKTSAWTTLLAGWQGPTTLLVAAAGPFLIQAPIALALLAAGRVNRRSTLPFGPAILLAALAALTLTQPN